MKFKLRVVRGEPHGKFLLFPAGEFVIGRGSECHIRPNSDWVSRQHCLLRVTRSTAHIRDLGSTNGTLINGVRVIGERKLIDGDQVQVGPLVFEARMEESILVTKAAPMQVSLPEQGPSQPNTGTEEMIALAIDSQLATRPALEIPPVSIGPALSTSNLSLSSRPHAA